MVVVIKRGYKVRTEPEEIIIVTSHYNQGRPFPGVASGVITATTYLRSTGSEWLF